MVPFPVQYTKLPSPADCCIPGLPVERLAGVYNILLGVERMAMDNNYNTLLQSARIIGQLLISFGDLHWLFGDEPLIRLTQGILSGHRELELGSLNPSNDVIAALNPVMHDLAMFYRENFLRVFRRRKGRTTELESPSSPRSFDSLQAIRDACLKGSNKDRALARDGFQCILTGRFDYESALQAQELRQVATAGSRPMGLVPTECHHIIPQWTAETVGSLGSRHPATRVLAAFGIAHDPSAQDELGNVVTLRTELHYLFTQLYIWLEPTPIANEHKLCGNAVFFIAYDLRAGDIIRLEDHSGSNPPLALRYLLALHGICARVAHSSGVLEYFGKWEDEHDDPPFLLSDGSSANVLIDRLNYELMVGS